MNAYVINLEAATDRWRFMQDTFAGLNFHLVRVAAVDGASLALPVQGYSEPLYRMLHGRTTNVREIGCYLSHVQACAMFLATGEEHGLICEDDVTVSEVFQEVIEKLLLIPKQWDIARLTGLRPDSGVDAFRLSATHALRVHFGRLKGAGAYLINRAAAQGFTANLLPMKLPFDHAVDREWRYGLRGVSVWPFPASQVQARFPTSIQRGPMRKLSAWRRCATTYPYQMLNELSRWVFRAAHLLVLKRTPALPESGGRRSAPTSGRAW